MDRTPLQDRIAGWASANPMSPLHVDCTTAVMLKILDGKCKMSEQEKWVMTVLYDQVYDRPGERLDYGVHDLIRRARMAEDNDRLLDAVYEQRVLAETMISRPAMKAFKGMLRGEGLIGG